MNRQPKDYPKCVGCGDFAKVIHDGKTMCAECWMEKSGGRLPEVWRSCPAPHTNLTPRQKHKLQ